MDNIQHYILLLEKKLIILFHRWADNYCEVKYLKETSKGNLGFYYTHAVRLKDMMGLFYEIHVRLLALGAICREISRP